MDNKSLLNKILIIDDIGTYEQINEQYFQRSIELGRNQSEGVVETPDTIVRFMIKLSIINIGKSINKIRWYDPCSGSGKFPYQILKMAISELDINFEEDLPEIYFFLSYQKMDILQHLTTLKDYYLSLDFLLNDILNLED